MSDTVPSNDGMTKKDVDDIDIIIQAARRLPDPLAELFKRGYSAADIARDLDVNERTVRKWRSGEAIADSRMNDLIRLIVGQDAMMLAGNRTLKWRAAMGVAIPDVTATRDEVRGWLTRFMTDPENKQHTEKQYEMLHLAGIALLDVYQSRGPLHLGPS